MIKNRKNIENSLYVQKWYAESKVKATVMQYYIEANLCSYSYDKFNGTVSCALLDTSNGKQNPTIYILVSGIDDAPVHSLTKSIPSSVLQDMWRERLLAFAEHSV